jgi:anti-sigma regulatory factor (Ser/Thr protein kinase)
MKEISLHLLDIAQNSISAGATNIRITVRESASADMIEMIVADNGCGMTEEFLRQVIDPFTTTRKTRKVGLGIPLLKMAAEAAEGSFAIESESGKGTKVTVGFKRSHIDRPPLGDMAGSIVTLIQGAPELDLLYQHITDRGEFSLSTSEVRAIMGDVALNEPMVLQWIRQFLAENIQGIHINP